MSGNDIIKIGLDFGTHQTKICIQKTPDEGHGEPSYEFFSFADLEGVKSYFLPSIVQINQDDTLSYGFVDRSKEKDAKVPPKLELLEIPTLDIHQEAKRLFVKYAFTNQDENDVDVIEQMLKLKTDIERQKIEYENEIRRSNFDEAVKKYRASRNIFRYFKQATFSTREWDAKIDSQRLCIWYLAYVIFLLEERYGALFSIHMGIPTDDNSFENKRKLAISTLASAYNLVENVFENDFNAFLKTHVDELLEKTKIVPFSNEVKEEYAINVFPEAYAGLLSLTSRGKLTLGMSLTVDIGGGTTDISFFTIDDRKPCIYKYWSIPVGLNYLAEESGFDYFEHELKQDFKDSVVDAYNAEKTKVVRKLISILYSKLSKTAISKNRLTAALKDRILVYMGGGSTFSNVTNEHQPFTDVRRIDQTIWKEEQVKDKPEVEKLCTLLSVSFGLVSAKDDDEVELYSMESIFGEVPLKSDTTIGNRYVDKDMV